VPGSTGLEQKRNALNAADPRRHDAKSLAPAPEFDAVEGVEKTSARAN